MRAYREGGREGSVPGRIEMLERSTTHPAAPIMASSKETGQKRTHIRAYQFAYSRIDSVDGDPNAHVARGVMASDMRGDLSPNFTFATHLPNILWQKTDPACRSAKIFPTAANRLAEKMRKQMAKQCVSDGLPKPPKVK